ncbi:MAG TPA: SDR family NAD(P)-dependent oxidoreductase [Alphaproteobacteria bacterium]|nr:SDR family NAD(P)-dependent oxidoreductase [Alphaproteobacteria bacterium]
MELKDRNVIVTGGTGALGGAVVGAVLEAGATCHVPVFDAAELEGFPYADHERVRLAQSVDLADEDAVARFYDAVDRPAAALHLVGGFHMAPITETGAADFEAQMRMNALTCFLCCRAAVAAFRRAGEGGRIVNVTARPALEPRSGAGMLAYTAAKAAVAAITQGLAEEVAEDRIAVHAIAPSIIDTPGNRAAMPKADFARWPRPEEIAEAMLALVRLDTAAARGALVPLYGRV